MFLAWLMKAWGLSLSVLLFMVNDSIAIPVHSIISHPGIFDDDDFDIPEIPIPNSIVNTSLTAQEQKENLFSSIPTKSWQNHYADGLRFNIFLPGNPDPQKEYPLVLFFSGFQADQPTVTYEDLLGEIAIKANGAIVVAWKGQGFSSASSPERSIEEFMQFYKLLKNGTVQEYINHNFTQPARYSMGKVFIAAHSAGNRLSVLLSEREPSLGMILIDPVDEDPLKIFPPVINGSLNYTNPILLFSTELGEKRGMPFIPPCVSSGSSLKYFNSFSSSLQKFMFNIDHYGHADFMSPDWLVRTIKFSHFCASVRDDKVHPRQDFRDFLSGSIAAFIDLYGEESEGFLQYLTNSSMANIDVKLTMIPESFRHARVTN